MGTLFARNSLLMSNTASAPARTRVLRVVAVNAPLAVVGLINLGLFALALAGLAADHRVITGAPV